MSVTPRQFDPLTQQGELKITDATVHCGTRAQAGAVARRLERQIDWPADCDWPPEQVVTMELKFWGQRLEAAQQRWNETVLAYKRAGGTDQDLIDDYFTRTAAPARTVSGRAGA